MIFWRLLSFNDLSAEQLYEIMNLRQQVFMIEQQMNYLDADGIDPHAKHLIGYPSSPASVPSHFGLSEVPCAYMRILGPNLKYPEVSFGRVLTPQEWRGKGMGKELLKKGLAEIENLYGPVPIRIAAETYLERFYKGFGFKTVGEPYLNSGVSHVEMLKDPMNSTEAFE